MKPSVEFLSPKGAPRHSVNFGMYAIDFTLQLDREADCPSHLHLMVDYVQR